jgi:hypothetical protein
MALGGHPKVTDQCPLSGVKRTSRFTAPMSAYDPKRTTQLLWCGSLRGYEALSYLGEAE